MNNIKIISVFVLGVVSMQSKAQYYAMRNHGIIKVNSGVVLSLHIDFINAEKGQFYNNGATYYFENFKNDGNYGYLEHIDKGNTFFVNKSDKNKIIQGNGLVSLNKVSFNNNMFKSYFDVKANIDIWGDLKFENGIIRVDLPDKETAKEMKGLISFMPEAFYKNASDKNFIQGNVEKIGKSGFVFPIGENGFYRPAKISASLNVKNVYQAAYHIDNDDFFNTHATKSGIIKELNEKEYWTIEKSNKNKGEILLTLTWDEEITPGKLLINPKNDLHIVRWDEKQKLWIDEGGVVDVEKKEVTTPTVVKGYGIFTLATVKTELILEGDIVIYDFVSPNNDGKNDYFLIENINRFPNNTVSIYDRWGSKVYQTSNYDSKGNVFKGYSEESLTINKNKKLASGTYFYIINYQYKDKNGSRMIKKSGFLHLENANL